jgi:membrane-bound lytic murein transglycosylase D
MLIRVRRKQSMAAIALRYGVSIGQLNAWNKTHRTVAMPGQVIVLHVPVGKAMPAEPGPQKLATAAPDGARAQKIDASEADMKPKSRNEKHAKGHGRTAVVKAASRTGKSARAGAASTESSTKPAAKAPKVAASRQKAAAGTRKYAQQ